MNNNNALAGLLTYSPFGLPSRPLVSGQWQWMDDGYGAYSCGTVQDYAPGSLLIPVIHRKPKAMQM